MKRIRRHLSYANVAATLALLFAMSGGAIAATGGFSSGGTLRACANGEGRLKLLKSGEHCRRGQKTVAWSQTGPAGVKGATGAAGASGPAGAAGATGANGFSALSTLPSGASESGAYSVETGNATVAQLTESESFSIPLAAPIDVTHVQYLSVGATGTNCPGVGQAARGFLCLYSGEETGLDRPEVFNFESRKFVEGTGRSGFSLQWTVLLKEAFDAGTWTVTAA